MSILKKNFTYIDLFAGIGGFHCAMNLFSHNKAKCIFASEIDENASMIYEKNFGFKPLGDICKINPSNHSSPDVVCGGFPCQTFSKAGKQNGFKDPRGTLFREIIRLIEFHKFQERPKILILENVRNLVSHDNGDTWKTIKHEIKNVGYNVIEKPLIVTPKDVGVPQLRDRAIILAVRNDLYSDKIDFTFNKDNKKSLSIKTILEDEPSEGFRMLNIKQKYAIDAWEDFIKTIGVRSIGCPFWSDDFDSTYSVDNLPVWKQRFVLKNREFYQENKKKIDSWMHKWDIRNRLTRTNRKFEWQAGFDINSIYEGIIQFRTSGIRVKRPTESPALVAMVHLPILGFERRTISIREAARLQSFPENYIFDESPDLAFKQLGNAVNVQVIYRVFKEFIMYLDSKMGDREDGK